jgi:lipoprotein-releasing system permease protein
MRFELAVAWRYFLSGRSQTLLTVAGTTVGVTVLIFISALVGGLQRTMVTRVLGTIAPVVVKPKRPQPRVLTIRPTTNDQRPTEPPPLHLTTSERFGREGEQIFQWQRVAASLQRLPGVSAVSPIVEGPAFAVRGTARRPVLLRGVDSARQDRIVAITARMLRGRFDPSGDKVVIGADLAEVLGAVVGDKLRLTSSQLRTEVLVVAGIFDLGFANLNERWVFVSRARAQRLLDLPGGVNAIELQTPSLFAADRIADRITQLTGLRAESWSRADPEFVSLIQVQSASSLLVRGFILIAVGFGIASVLVVAVLQRSRDIGILRSMGTPGRSIATIFLLQAGLVGVTGALLGTLCGVGLSLALGRVPGSTAHTEFLFPIELQPTEVLYAAVAAVVAALVAGFIPARRATLLDPVEVISHV